MKIKTKMKSLCENVYYMPAVTKTKALKIYEMTDVDELFTYIIIRTPRSISSIPIPTWFLKKSERVIGCKEKMLNALGEAFYKYFWFTGHKNYKYFINDFKELDLINHNLNTPTRWGLAHGLFGFEFFALDLSQVKGSYDLVSQDYRFNKAKVYIMIDHNTGYYKIGKSKTPWFREKTLQSEKPTIEMIKVFQYANEKTLHKMLKDKRIRGEWFDLDRKDFEEIAEKYN